MKTIKKFKTAIFLLGIAAAISSCKKESFESNETGQAETTEIQNDVSDNLPEPGNGERETGCLLLSPVEYEKLPKEADGITNQSITSVSLQCPSIKNQGGEGSCVAFGTAYAARSIVERNKTGGSFSTFTNVFSPEYVYNQIKVGSGCGGGAYVTDALDLMKCFPFGGGGVCTWAMMPYSSTNGCGTMPSSKQIDDANDHCILGYSTISKTKAAIKSKLNDGRPVIVAGPVDVNFVNLGNNQIYTSYSSASFLGNHCYCVVGYNDNKNAFKVMNSWGTNWGTSGFGWIDYNLVSTMFVEAYVLGPPL